MARWPVDNVYITQDFGENLSPVYRQWGFLGHTGIDLAVPYRGAPILSPAPGTVIFASWDNSGFGYLMMIRDPWGYTHLLGHNLNFIVGGGGVGEGQPVARADSTGNSSGDHCHWEVWPPNRNPRNGYNGAINPRDWLNWVNTNMAVSQDAYNALLTERDQYAEFAAELLYTLFLHVPSQGERQLRVNAMRGINSFGALWDAVANSGEAHDRIIEFQTLVYKMAFGPDRQINVAAELEPRVPGFKTRQITPFNFVRDIFNSEERATYVKNLRAKGNPALEAENARLRAEVELYKSKIVNAQKALA